MRWTRPVASGFTYSLKSALYVPLTSRCNSQTLPQTRGPNFFLPPQTVAALCRVRDAEQGTAQWKHWCLWLDMQESPQKPPEPLGSVALLEKGSCQESIDGRRPTVSELWQEIESNDSFESIVLAGEGEPTLRLDALEELVQKISRGDSTKTSIRVTTNGLVMDAHDCAARLQACGVNSVSVALMTHDANQYDSLMQPVLCSKDVSAHDRVQEFIRAAVRVGLQVGATAVDRPEIDKDATESLARSLGVPLRWRPYFA